MTDGPDVQSNIQVNIDTTAAVAELKNLQRQISLFHSQMGKAGAASAASASNLQRNLVNSINAGGQFTAQFKTVATTTETFTRALETNKLSMGQYFKYAGAATKTFGRLFKTEFDTINRVAESRVKTLQTQYIKLGRDANGAMKAIAVRPVALNMQDLGTKTQIAAQRQALLNQLLKQGSTSMLNFGKNTQWAGRQLMVGFTVPLMYLGTAAAKTFMDIEKEVVRFKRVYGDFNTTADATNAMAKELQTLASEFTKYGVAVKDTMAMAADAAAMGKQGADLVAQVTEANRLAVLGMVDQQQALQTTMSLTNAFGMATEDLAKSTDFLNAVENQTVLSIEDLTIAIPKAGPVVKQLGGNVQDLAFFMTAMKEGGINASEGANALKSGLASMINPSAKASKFISSLGINLKGIVEANKGDLKGTVIGFAQALDTIDPLNRARAIEQLFGKFQFARISTLFQNVIKEGTQAQTTLQLAKATSEELAILSERELKQTSDSPMYKFQKSVEDLKKSLAPVGKVFLETVTPVVDFFKNVLDKFNNLSDGTKSVITKIVAVVAGIGPVVLMTFGLLANGVANIIKGFSAVKSLFNRTGSASQILGEQTNYLTTAELEAAAAAASLDQAHQNLTQRFTGETEALKNLITMYQKALVEQGKFGMGGAIPGMRKPIKRAMGGIVRGPGTGTSDSIPAMISNGEAIIPAASVARNPQLVNALVSGSIAKFAEGRLGSGNTGRVGKSISAIVRPYGANVSNTAGLINFTDISAKSLADVSSLYAKEIAENAGVKIAQINKEIDQWSLANKTAIDAATAAVNSGVPASEAFAELSDKFAKDMLSGETAIGKFTATAKEMAPALQQDLIQAQEYAKKMSLDLRTAAGTTALAAALPENKIAQSLATPGNYQRLSKVRTAAASIFGGSQGINTFGIPRFMLSKGTVPGDLAYKLGTSQEHVSTTVGQENQRRKISQTRINRGLDYGEKLGQEISESFKNSMVRGAKKTLRVNSPSKETQKIGEAAGQGFIVGAESQIDDAKVAGEQLANAQVSGVREAQKTQSRNARLAAREMAMYDQISPKRQAMLRAAQTAALPTGMSKKVGINWRSSEQLRIQRMTDEEVVAILKAEAAEEIRLSKLASQEKLAILKAKNEQTVIADKEYAAAWNAAHAENNARRLAIEEQSMPMYGPQKPTRWDKTGGSLFGKLRAKKGMKPNIAGMGSKIGGAAMTASMLAMMGSMAGGPIGDISNKLMMPLMGLSMIGPMLPALMNPWVAAGAALVAVAGSLWFLDKKSKDASEATSKFVDATAATTEKMKSVGSITGKVGASELQAKIRESTTFNKYGSSSDLINASFGKKFLTTDIGKEISDSFAKNMEQNGAEKAAKAFSLELASYVSDGILTAEQANSVAKQIGINFKDMSLSSTISGKLSELIGPDGKDILKNPLEVRLKIIGESKQDFKALLQDYGNLWLEQQQTLENTTPGLSIGGIRLLNGKELSAFAEHFTTTPTQKLAATISAYGVQYLESIQAQADAQQTLNNKKEEELKTNLKNAKTDAEKLKIQKELDTLSGNSVSDQQKFRNEMKEALRLQNEQFQQAKETSGQTDAFIESMQSQIRTKWAGNPFLESFITAAAKLKSMNLEVKIGSIVGAGLMNPGQAESLVKLFAGKEKQLEKIINLSVNTIGIDKMGAFVSMLGQEGLKDTTKKKLLIDMSETDPAKFEELASVLTVLKDAQLNGFQIDLLLGGDPVGKLAEFAKDFDKINKIFGGKSKNKKNLILNVVTETNNQPDPKLASALAASGIWKDIMALPETTRKQAIYTLTTIIDTLDINAELEKMGQTAQEYYRTHPDALAIFKSQLIKKRFSELDFTPAPADPSGKTPPAGTTDTTSAAEKAKNAMLALLEKEIRILKRKSDALKKVNDELKRQQDFEMKQAELNKSMVQAKISGDYLGAAIIGQQKRFDALDYKRESDQIALDNRISALEQVVDKINNKDRLTRIEQLLVKKVTGKTYKAADGGHITGPGTGTSDSIPAYLSNGEYVVKADSVKKYGKGFFDSVNAQKFANGGSAGGKANKKSVKDMIMAQDFTKLPIASAEVPWGMGGLGFLKNIKNIPSMIKAFTSSKILPKIFPGMSDLRLLMQGTHGSHNADLIKNGVKTAKELRTGWDGPGTYFAGRAEPRYYGPEKYGVRLSPWQKLQVMTGKKKLLDRDYFDEETIQRWMNKTGVVYGGRSIEGVPSLAERVNAIGGKHVLRKGYSDYLPYNGKIVQELIDSGYVGTKSAGTGDFNLWNMGEKGWGLKKLSRGGLIKGPGTSTSDSILGYAGGGLIGLSNKEYVVKASTVAQNGVKALDALNSGNASIRANDEVGPAGNQVTVYNNYDMTITGANPEEVTRKVIQYIEVQNKKNGGSNLIKSGGKTYGI